MLLKITMEPGYQVASDGLGQGGNRVSRLSGAGRWTRETAAGAGWARHPGVQCGGRDARNDWLEMNSV